MGPPSDGLLPWSVLYNRGCKAWYPDVEMLDLDSLSLDTVCPRCRFWNDFTVRQVRLRDVIICRGCHSNIQLEDELNTVRKARTAVNRAMRELEDSLKSMSGIITLEL